MTAPRAPKVLVVDDNAITRKLLRVTLSGEGYAVVEAEDGASAVRLLKAEKPDLILQDLVLPDTGGIELVERLRAEPAGASIPILAFSGFQSEMELAEKLRVGFTDFLFKPVEPSRLLQVVQAYLPKELPARTLPAPGARLVVADDDEIQLKLMRVRLERQGYEVTTATSGIAALKAVRDTHPDALISDVLMPGMDGFTLCLAVKRDPAIAQTPVVLTSCVYTEPGDLKLARQVGACDLVHRTGDLSAVLETLTHALSQPTAVPAVLLTAVPTEQYLQRVVRQLERQAEQNLAHTTRLSHLETELSLLAGLSELLAANAPLSDILSELLQRCLDGSELSFGAIFLLQDGNAVPIAESGIRLGHALDAAFYGALAEGMSATDRPRLIQQPDAPVAAQKAAFERLDAKAIVIIPLQVHASLAGAMILASTRIELGEDWISFAQTVGNHVSNAIAQAEARQRLEESELLYRAVVENLNEGVSIVSGGVRILVNQAYLDIFGLDDPSQAVGKPFIEYILPEDRHIVQAAFEAGLRGEPPSPSEARVLRADGETRILRAAPLLIPYQGQTAMLTVLHDVTGERTAEQARVAAIDARERETQLLLDIEHSLLATQDLQHFLAESADRIMGSGPYDVAAIQLLDQDGKETERRIARGFRDLDNVPALFRERSPGDEGAPRLRGLSDSEPSILEDIVAQGRFQSLQRDGVHSVLWVPIHSDAALLGRMVLGLRTFRAIPESEIRLMASIGNHLGVAAQKAELYENTRRAVEEREQAEAQLRQASKMEAVGNLAGGVAHDFNNLLTVIIGFGEMALDGNFESEAVRGYVQEMVKAGERAGALTHQLLAFSRRQVLRPEVINLNVVVENMDRLLQRVIGEDIDLQTRLQEDLGYARADPGQVEQVIINLAVNARDAMANGGQLTIETRNVVLDQTYADEHAEVNVGPYVLLSVTDNGTGISPEVLGRIFEPFFTTKEPGKGTGLGLATVHGIVKQSGGHLSVYSEVGIGTTFKIYLPEVEAPAPVESAAAPTQPDRAARGGTILLVEDELGVRALARAVLGGAGYSVLEAASPDEALHMIERLTRPVELMLTDVVMPGMNGPTLATQVSARWPSMKVIFMSGYPGDSLRRQGTIGPDIPYLEKPFTPTALRAKVREVLEADS